MKKITLFIFISIQSSLFTKAQNPELTVPLAHTGQILSTQFSADSKFILTSGEHGQVKVWEASSGTLLRSLTGYTVQDNITSTFSPNGKYIAAINLPVNQSSKSRVLIWETLTGKLVREMTAPNNISRTGTSYSSIQYTPDGKYLVTVVRENNAYIWDADKGELLRTLSGHTSQIEKMQMSSDGATIMTFAGETDKTAKLWQASTGRLERSIKASSSTLSPSGKYLLVGNDGPGPSYGHKIMDAKTAKDLYSLDFDKHSRGMSFSPDDKYLIESDREIVVWDVKTGKLLQRKKAQEEMVDATAFKLSKDGKYIFTASRDKKVRQWALPSGNLANAVDVTDLNTPIHLNLSPDGNYLLVSSGSTFDFKLWDSRNMKEIVKPIVRHGILSSLSPDGKTILTSIDATVRLWDAATGQAVLSLNHESSVLNASYSPDGKFILAVCKDGTTKLWNADTGKIVSSIANKNSQVQAASFSRDGKHVITNHKSSEYSNFFQVWSIASQRLVYSVGENSEFPAYRLELSPDARYAVTAYFGMQPNCRIWKDGKLQSEVSVTVNYFHTIRFTPDGKFFLSTGDGDMNIWDPVSGKLIRTIKDSGYLSDAYVNAFSPDSKYVATSSGNNISIWEISTGKLVRTLENDSPVRLVKYLSGTEITTLSEKSVSTWNANSGKLIKQLPVKLKMGPTSLNTAVTKALVNERSMMTYYDLTSTREVSWSLVGPADWVVISSSGLFDATADAMKLLYFVQGSDVVQFDQLKERYYEPNLWRKVMNGEDLREVASMKSIDLPPDIIVAAVDEKGYLPIQLINKGGGIGEVKVYIQGKEVTADARAKDANPDAPTLKINFYVGTHRNLVKGENYIGVKAWNKAQYVVSKSALVTYVNGQGQSENYKPSVFIVTSGVSDYAGEKDIDLTYAAKDAEDMGKALNLGATNLFGTGKSYTYNLTTSQPRTSWPTKTNIVKAFQEIAKTARPMDVIVVYLSGHGINVGGTDGDWHYLTQEAYTTTVSAYSDPGIRQQTTLSSSELVELFKTIPASKQVLIIDACASGKIVENLIARKDVPSSTLRALDRMKDRMGMHIITGCAADAVSYEASKYGQGVLTYSLLEGIRGASLREGEFVDVNMLFQYARERVPALAVGIGGIQTPMVFSPQGSESFDIGQLSELEKKAVPLSKVKPVYIQSNFQDEQDLSDVLSLGKKIDELLNESAAKGTEASFVFVPVREYPDACQLVGRYETLKGKIVLKMKKKCEGNDATVTLSGADKDDLAAQVMKYIAK